MSVYFAKQPNELYCRFSKAADSLTHWNMTRKEAIILFKLCEGTEEGFDTGLIKFDELYDMLVAGENINMEDYYNFQMDCYGEEYEN